jgi:hypothetical protein
MQSDEVPEKAKVKRPLLASRVGLPQWLILMIHQ